MVMVAKDKQELLEKLNNAKLSTLLRVAVADFRIVLREPTLFVPNMGYYVASYRPISERCVVCLAGASMYIRLGIRNSYKEGVPLFASKINYMRVGDLAHAADIPSVVRQVFRQIVLSTYSNDLDNDGRFLNAGRARLKTYLKAATYLEKEGW